MVVELRPGRGPALCLIHTAIGDTACYAALVAALGGDHPVVAIVPDGLAPDDPQPVDDLVEMARGYLAALVRAVPVGPYRLAGWAMGGVVAAELSEQLRESGHVADLLAVIDGRAPQPEMRSRPIGPAQLGPGLAHHIARVAGAEVDPPPTSGDPAEIHAALVRAGVLPSGWDIPAVARRLAVFTANVRALFGYAPRSLSTPLLLLESSDQHPAHPKPPSLGWEPFATVTRIMVPGTHYTLLDAATIGPLAAALTAAIGRADVARGSA